MTAVEALQTARAVGVEIMIDGDNLILEASVPPPDDIVRLLTTNKTGILALLQQRDDAWSMEDWQTFFNERAGIAEYDGGQNRQEAEARAMKCCIVEWLNRNPQYSDPGRCAWCGQPDRNEHTVVPFGIAEHGHTWLHPECWNNWHSDRRARARQALEGIGISASITVQKR